MNKTGISWTNYSWNPVHGCSRVSEGCRYCYAATLSQKFRITTADWTEANAVYNVLVQHHKLGEVLHYREAGSMVFVCSMSDLFHRLVPDFYRAAIWALMLHRQDLTFQVLTKRPENMHRWLNGGAYAQTLQSDAYKEYALSREPKIRDVLLNAIDSPLAPMTHIWCGTSVERWNLLYRVATLQTINAPIRWLSVEPLLSTLAPTGTMPDLTGIAWVVVGGESGAHMRSKPDRWMKMEWAREIKDYCVEHRIAFYFKQQSGQRSGESPYLVEDDGSRWQWHQYPNQLTIPTRIED